MLLHSSGWRLQKDGSRNGKKKNERMEGKDVKGTAIFSR
ncbi:hypothetical protein CHCC16874_0082 [Bacillus licheniformis]|nr:hypothetical protein CHCC16874_0082 [Bacillus licheniformis]